MSCAYGVRGARCSTGVLPFNAGGDQGPKTSSMLSDSVLYGCHNSPRCPSISLPRLLDRRRSRIIVAVPSGVALEGQYQQTKVLIIYVRNVIQTCWPAQGRMYVEVCIVLIHKRWYHDRVTARVLRCSVWFLGRHLSTYDVAISGPRRAPGSYTAKKTHYLCRHLWYWGTWSPVLYFEGMGVTCGSLTMQGSEVRGSYRKSGHYCTIAHVIR